MKVKICVKNGKFHTANGLFLSKEIELIKKEIAILKLKDGDHVINIKELCANN